MENGKSSSGKSLLIGFDASRAFVSEATGTENYSLSLLKALAKVDRRNKYRVYLRGAGPVETSLPASAPLAPLEINSSKNKEKFTSSDNEKRAVGIPSSFATRNFNWPSNFEFVSICPSRFWTQLGLALETWRNPVDVLFVPAHTLPILRRRQLSVLGFQLSDLGLSVSRLISFMTGKPKTDKHIPENRQQSTDNRKTKYVVTIHDLGVEYLPNYHQFPQRYYLDFASKYAAGHADAIIAVSQATKDDLASRYKVGRKKVFVIHEGVDTKFFKSSSKSKVQSVKSKYGINGEYILFVGTVQPRKNLEMLIKAFSLLVGSGELVVGSKAQKTTNYKLQSTNYKLQTINLVIAGKLGWDYREILEAPKKYGVEKRVKFLNYVNKRDLPALYSGAAVFVFPSLFEGFGLPILEALSCGCPVIASDIAPYREIRFSVLGSRLSDTGQPVSQLTGQQKTDEQLSENRQQRTDNDLLEPIVLVKVNDVDEWARILYQYISQYDIRQSLVSERRKLASTFSWDEAARQTIDVFKKLA